MLFTDAIIEAEAESGEYGFNRVIEEVTREFLNADALAQKLVQSVRCFSGGAPITDDLTLVIAEL